jgi:steroid delta-isomerase-like uncharacterized protein
MLEGNEAVVRRLIEEVFNRGQTGLMAEFVAADHVGHDPFGDHYGPEGMRIAVAEYRAAFPDLRVTVEDLVTGGDKVAYRFTLRGTHSGPFLGIPPTGRAVTTTGVAIDRLAGGKVAESWVGLDALNLLRQLGASPMLRPADLGPTDTDSPPPGVATG